MPQEPPPSIFCTYALRDSLNTKENRKQKGEDLDLKVDETFTIFLRILGAGLGQGAPRTEALLRQALYALMEIPNTTLLDLVKLLDRNDPSYRKWVVTQLKDEEARRFWRSNYPSYPKDAHLPLLNRMTRFLKPKAVRRLLCSSGECLDVREAMDSGKILLFNLSDGLLGETNAQLLDTLVCGIASSAQLRAKPILLRYISVFLLKVLKGLR